MKIVTSNIRFANITDGKDSWDNRKSFLALTLLRKKPDIIGSQEGRRPQLREFESLLDGFTINDSHREWLNERMYPCLYSRDNELTRVLESGDFWLSETPDIAGTKLQQSAFPRLCSWVKYCNLSIEFLVFNVHLDHTTDEVRMLQVKILSEEIKKINTDSLPIVLMGDFNSSPLSDVYKFILKELSLIDPWKSLNKVEETSYHQFRGVFDGGFRIDWILHSPEFTCLDVQLLKDNEKGYFPSDHFPLFCDIILKK